MLVKELQSLCLDVNLIGETGPSDEEGEIKELTTLDKEIREKNDAKLKAASEA